MDREDNVEERPDAPVYTGPILRQPNEIHCNETNMVHILDLPPCCPVTDNPQPGSKVRIAYQANEFFLEVVSLRAYVDSFRGGRGAVRSMEAMIQQIAKDCANCVNKFTVVTASLIIDPGQAMDVECRVFPDLALHDREEK